MRVLKQNRIRSGISNAPILEEDMSTLSHRHHWQGAQQVKYLSQQQCDRTDDQYHEYTRFRTLSLDRNRTDSTAAMWNYTVNSNPVSHNSTSELCEDDSWSRQSCQEPITLSELKRRRKEMRGRDGVYKVWRARFERMFSVIHQKEEESDEVAVLLDGRRQTDTGKETTSGINELHLERSFPDALPVRERLYWRDGELI